MGFGVAPQPILRFERLELLERFEPAADRYSNSGMTFSAKSRMFFSAISCGMPPK
jgi:hypothetical protein